MIHYYQSFESDWLGANFLSWNNLKQLKYVKTSSPIWLYVNAYSFRLAIKEDRIVTRRIWKLLFPFRCSRTTVLKVSNFSYTFVYGRIFFTDILSALTFWIVRVHNVSLCTFLTVRNTSSILIYFMGMEWYPWGHPLMCLGTIEVVRWYRFYVNLWGIFGRQINITDETHATTVSCKKV